MAERRTEKVSGRDMRKGGAAHLLGQSISGCGTKYHSAAVSPSRIVNQCIRVSLRHRTQLHFLRYTGFHARRFQGPKDGANTEQTGGFDSQTIATAGCLLS